MDLFEGTIVEDRYVLYENALKGLPKHIAHAIGKSGGGRHSQVTSEPIHTHSKLHDTLHGKLKDHDGVHVLFHNDKPVAAVHSMRVAGKKNPDFTVSGHSHDQFIKHMNKGEAINHLVGRLATHASGDLKDKGTYARDKVELRTYHKDWIRDLKHDRRDTERKKGHDRLHDVRDRALDKLAQRHVGDAGSEIHRAKEIHKKLGKAIEDNDAEAIKKHSNELSGLTSFKSRLDTRGKHADEYKLAIKSLKNAKDDWSKRHARNLVQDVHARINTQEGRVEDKKLDLAETYMAMKEPKVRQDDLNEDVEQIDELSKGTLKKYVNRSLNDVRNSNRASIRWDSNLNKKIHTGYDDKGPTFETGKDVKKRHDLNAKNRETGIRRAIDRLTKEDVEQIDESHVADGYHVVGGKDQRYHGFHRDADHAINHADALENSSGYVHQVHHTKNGKIVKTWQWSDPDQKFSSHVYLKGQDAHHILPPRLHEDVEQIDELSKKTLASYIDKAVDHAGLENRFKHRDARNGDKNKAERRETGIKTAAKKLAKEDVEQIDELSKKTLGDYIKKSKNDLAKYYVRVARNNSPKDVDKIVNRTFGINRAVDRLTKEDVELSDDELEKIEELLKGMDDEVDTEE